MVVQAKRYNQIQRKMRELNSHRTSLDCLASNSATITAIFQMRRARVELAMSKDDAFTERCTTIMRPPHSATGRNRTCTNKPLRLAHLPLGYSRMITPVGVEPTPFIYKMNALDHMSFGVMTPDNRFERLNFSSKARRDTTSPIGNNLHREIRTPALRSQAANAATTPYTDERKVEDLNPLACYRSQFSRLLPDHLGIPSITKSIPLSCKEVRY